MGTRERKLSFQLIPFKLNHTGIHKVQNKREKIIKCKEENTSTKFGDQIYYHSSRMQDPKIERKKENVKNLVHKKQSACHTGELEGPQLPIYMGTKQVKFAFGIL